MEKKKHTNTLSTHGDVLYVIYFKNIYKTLLNAEEMSDDDVVSDENRSKAAYMHQRMEKE